MIYSVINILMTKYT